MIEHFKKYFIFYIILLLLLLFVTVLYVNYVDWEEFKNKHNCHIVETTPIEDSFIPMINPNGTITMMFIQSGGETGWLCDDNVTYWR